MLNHKRRKGTHMYYVIFDNGEQRFFLAEDDEDAAWYSLDIAKEHGRTVHHVNPYDQKEETLSPQ